MNMSETSEENTEGNAFYKDLELGLIVDLQATSQAEIQQNSPVQEPASNITITRVMPDSSCTKKTSRKNGKKSNKPYQASQPNFGDTQSCSMGFVSNWLETKHELPQSSAERELLHGVLLEERKVLKSMVKTIQRDLKKHLTRTLPNQK